MKATEWDVWWEAGSIFTAGTHMHTSFWWVKGRGESGDACEIVTIRLGCCCSFGFWAGFLGVLGGVWIAPAITPASHLPSSGHPNKSCRSNQSLPDCLTFIVVIRQTPVSPLRVYLPRKPYISLFHLPRPLSVFRFLVPVSPSMVGFPLQPVSLTCLLAPMPTWNQAK